MVCQMPSRLKYETESHHVATAAATVAGEDLAAGDYVASLNQTWSSVVPMGLLRRITVAP